MSQPDPNLPEALSAWMDGELPPDQARFMERRLASAPALRDRLERWQLASAALRGERLRLMPAGLAEGIAAAVAAESRPRGRRWPWAAGAVAAALALALLPGLLGTGNAPDLPPAAPGLATRPGLPPLDMPPLDMAPVAPVSPLPVQADGLALGPVPVARPWPRSPVARDPRAMEAYLVRHNALMAQDGLGGFMPYVDVVVHDEAAAAQPGREPEDR